MICKKVRTCITVARQNGKCGKGQIAIRRAALGQRQNDDSFSEKAGSLPKANASAETVSHHFKDAGPADASPTCSFSDVPGFFLSTTSALATGRSSPSHGRFWTLPSYQSVADPPPSRFTTSRQPSSTKKEASSLRVMPTESRCRPSTSTRKNESSFQPIAERG